MMRKLSIMLVLFVLLVCFVACQDDEAKEPASPTGKTEVTTAAVVDVTKEPAKEETKTEAPETPLYDWTSRY